MPLNLEPRAIVRFLLRALPRIAQALLVLLAFGCGPRKLLERDYQEWWCRKNNGEMEHRLADGARVDCLTDEYAVEVEYAHKWAESVGQSLYYASCTGRKPGIVVIVRDASEEKLLKRLRQVAKEQGIRVWKVKPEQVE